MKHTRKSRADRISDAILWSLFFGPVAVCIWIGAYSVGKAELRQYCATNPVIARTPVCHGGSSNGR